jgi:hypothetical protein
MSPIISHIVAIPLLCAALVSDPRPTVDRDVATPLVRKLVISDRLKISIEVPRLKSNALLAREVNREMETLWSELCDTYRKELESMRQSAKEHGFTPVYDVEIAFEVCYFSDELICLTTRHYEDGGGAHGNTTFGGLCYRMHRGQLEEITLPQLFRRDSNFIEKLSVLIIQDLKRQKASSVVNGEIKQFKESDLSGFVITADGLTFAFSPYAVGCYAEGAFFVTLPFDELRDIADPSGPLSSPGLLRPPASGATTRPAP